MTSAVIGREARVVSVPADEQRQVESTVRMNKVTSLGAGLITILTIAETWGNWRSVAIVCAAQVVLIAFNVWANLVLLRLRGVRFTESVRTFVNVSGFIVIAQFTHFPLAVWLWLPFSALTFDHFSPRVANLVLVTLCAVADSLAFLVDVPWRYPMAFTSLAFVCLAFSRARFDLIRDMLLQSDAQRRDLELAHREVQRAHVSLTQETRAREAIEVELRQAQTLEAIGRLASGIAHEINTPVQFVGDGVHFLKDATEELLALIGKCRSIARTIADGGPVAEAAHALAQAEEQADLVYLTEQVPAAISRTLAGVERIAVIVRSMREFAHPDQKDATAVDLNRALDATIVIARHEYKLVADVETEFAALPLVTCHPGEVNQVFLNILVNAAQAVADVVKRTGKRGRISIRTQSEGDHVLVTIADTGGGIPEDIWERVFEPFFTTKEIGKGTGQGLAIARKVVIAHGGTLSFESQIGAGTKFFIRLPVESKQASGADVAA